ncbi:MAG: hypothetical protein U0984_17315, partial [Prosthecobacter sp.]|nr:hypothetical protein [Prosthecobacter sp.]
ETTKLPVQPAPTALEGWSRGLWIGIIAIFLVGIVLRIAALNLPYGPDPERPQPRWQPAKCSFLESDERIYLALVDQYEAGRGHTLHGHPILDLPWISRNQYDKPVFFHPPGGIVYFWFCHYMVGDGGFALAEVLAFALFYFSVLSLAWEVFPHRNWVAMFVVAILAAITPIMAHVTGRLWLDGPLLGFTTAAAAVFVTGVRKSSIPQVGLAAMLAGYASMIKLTAVFALPGMVLLAWSITPPEQRRRLFTWGALLIAGVALFQLPWAIWQWKLLGSPLPLESGRPSEELLSTNAYVRYLTVDRSPWIYLTHLPQVIWTLVPALALWAVQWGNRMARERGLALIGWIAFVVGAQIALGFLGYSKLLRYVILVSPATVLLLGIAIDGAIAGVRERASEPEWRVAAISICGLLAVAGLALEVTQGVRTSFYDNRRHDIIMPLIKSR